MPWTSTPPEYKQSAVLVVSDDFTRANTTEPNIGTAPLGGGWTLLGGNGAPPASKGKISSNYVVSSTVGQGGNFYAALPAIGARAVELYLKVKWVTAGGTGNPPFIASGFTNSLSPYVAYNCVYSRFYRNNVTLDVFVNGTMTNIQQVAISPDLSLDTDHELHWLIRPDRGIVKLYVDGTLKVNVATDSMKQYLNYRIPFFQLSYPASDATAEGRIKSFICWDEYGWANCEPGTIQP